MYVNPSQSAVGGTRELGYNDGLSQAYRSYDIGLSPMDTSTSNRNFVGTENNYTSLISQSIPVAVGVNQGYRGYDMGVSQPIPIPPSPETNQYGKYNQSDAPSTKELYDTAVPLSKDYSPAWKNLQFIQSLNNLDDQVSLTSGTTESGNSTQALGNFTAKDHFLLLNGLNIGSYLCSNNTELSAKDLAYYVPLTLKVMGEVPQPIIEQVDEYMGINTIDSALRTLLYFLYRSKILLPTTGTVHWGSSPTDGDRALATYFDRITKSPPEQGTIQEVKMADPVFGIPEIVTRVETIRIFSSQARPRLLKLKYERNPSNNMIIFKSGDDLSLDFMVQIISLSLTKYGKVPS